MTAAIILAAGESSRLGFPKQTLLYKGQTLLERAADATLKSKCKPIIVVLGAHLDKIKAIPDTITLINKEWQEGVASSIRTAILHIEKDATIESAIILLCDQPFISRALLDSMIYKQLETGRAMVACSYNSTVGVPVLFKRSLFPDLLLLNGKDGAKKIINDHFENVAVIPFEKGGTDIDTVADYENLLKSGN